MTSENYKPLLSDPENRNSVDDLSDTDIRPFKPKIWSSRLVKLLPKLQPYIIATLSFILAIHLYFDNRTFHSRCVRELHTASPILSSGVLDKYTTVNLNGTLNFKEKWAGTPNDARDEQWQSIIKDVWIPVTDDEVRKMGKDPEKVVRVPPQYRDQYGDGAIGVMDFAHQMHCLDLVRKYTYFDYYMEKQDEEAFGNPPHVLRVHIDHCIDMMRQMIMCNADPGIVTHFWVEGRPTPYPDFSMQKQCKDPWAMVEWAEKKAIPGYKPIYPSPGEFIYPWDPEIL